MIYFDSAATTLVKPPGVARAVARAVRTLASPGRGGYPAAMAAADTAYACREALAGLFHVPDPEKIVFTGNATHALNIAIKSRVRPGDRVLVSGYEHNSVIRPLRALGAHVVVAGSELFQPEEALLSFERRLTPDLALVVCNHVSNVFGYIQPVERIAEACREMGVPFLLDASQSAGTLPVDAEELQADFIAMPGHKGLFGPQGTGVLICREDDAKTLLEGGTGSESLKETMPDFLPDRLEAGTHNMAGIAGLLEGLRFVRRQGTEKIFAYEHGLLEEAVELLSGIRGLRLFTREHQPFQTGVLSFTLRDMDPEIVARRLGEKGIAVRAGFHCAPYAHKSAGTLDTGTVRLSFSPFNTSGELRHLAAVLNKLAEE